jgi:hypothetical protein
VSIQRAFKHVPLVQFALFVELRFLGSPVSPDRQRVEWNLRILIQRPIQRPIRNLFERESPFARPDELCFHHCLLRTILVSASVAFVVSNAFDHNVAITFMIKSFVEAKNSFSVPMIKTSVRTYVSRTQTRSDDTARIKNEKREICVNSAEFGDKKSLNSTPKRVLYAHEKIYFIKKSVIVINKYRCTFGVQEVSH